MRDIEFGKIINHLEEIIKDRGITQTKISRTLGLEPKQIKAYCSQEIQKYDMSIMAKFCFLLECEVGDILEYAPPSFAKKGR